MPCWDKTKPSWNRQAAGPHTGFGVQAAARAPHRQNPQGASPGMNILPLLLCIPGANFRLFLRFKGPASKWTGISPRGRLGAPPCPKTRSGVLQHTLPCSNTPSPAATRPTQRQHTLAVRHRTSPRAKHTLTSHVRQTPFTPRPSNSLHPAPFKPHSAPPFLSSSHPVRFPNSSIAAQNRSHGFHVVSNRSPSRIRSVRLISLGMTTRPSSSILRTIPVARNVPILLDGGATLMLHCFAVCLCIPSMEFGGVIMRRKDLGRAATGGVLEKNSAQPKPGASSEKLFYCENSRQTRSSEAGSRAPQGKKRHLPRKAVQDSRSTSA